MIALWSYETEAIPQETHKHNNNISNIAIQKPIFVNKSRIKIVPLQGNELMN